MKKGIYYAAIIGGLSIELASAGYLGKEIIKYGFNDNTKFMETDKEKKNVVIGGIALTGGAVISLLARTKQLTAENNLEIKLK